MHAGGREYLHPAARRAVVRIDRTVAGAAEQGVIADAGVVAIQDAGGVSKTLSDASYGAATIDVDGDGPGGTADADPISGKPLPATGFGTNSIGVAKNCTISFVEV